MNVYITGIGMVTPLGSGWAASSDGLKRSRCALGRLHLFDVPEDVQFPVGEVQLEVAGSGDDLPRTHRLALEAGRQALAGRSSPPDALVIGTSTGGIAATEEHLRADCTDPAAYRYHSPGSVAASLAGTLLCRGPALTVSTACSSGLAAVSLGAALLRSGRAQCVLAGGCDALCRLTYHGFNALQVVDGNGCRPLDRDRRGMTVAEGAAMLLLEAADSPPPGAVALVAGSGLSCDAYHPAAPHPRGEGAIAAMEQALHEAALLPEAVDLILLHGTGTVDNDLAEARAVKKVFGGVPPPLSSIKGTVGHSLAAAGAIATAAAAICLLSRRLYRRRPSMWGRGDSHPHGAFGPTSPSRGRGLVPPLPP